MVGDCWRNVPYKFVGMNEGAGLKYGVQKVGVASVMGRIDLPG